MSQHPSLKFSGVGSQHRNVLKRYERIKLMMEKDKLKEGASMFGLPKIKRLRLKIKKEKTEETAKVATEATPSSATEAKPQEGQQATAKGKK